MHRLHAAPRPSRAAHEELTALEYAMATSFVLISLLVAVPAVPSGLRSAARALLAPFA